MDLYRLDSTKRIDKLIENYTSLIWTERYRPNGDFELKSGKISQIRSDLPIGSLVTIGESNELMFVEDQTIDRDANGVGEITLTGRTFETFLEYRPAVNNLTKLNDTLWNLTGNSPSKAALVLLNATIISSAVDSKNNIPGLSLYDDASSVVTTTTARSVHRGDVYSMLLSLLTEGGLGIKNVRPATDGANVQMRMYLGTNRTATVLLDSRAEHFNKAKYFNTNRGSLTGVYAYCNLGAAQWHTNNTNSDTTNTGLNRKIGMTDNSDITDVNFWALQLKARAYTYLGDHKDLNLIECEVSSSIPYAYNVDYFLGDLINCRGEYGASSNMYVTEFIRTKNATGETGIPTLSATL